MPAVQLETNVWREACRHIEIEESVDRIAPILARALPVELVLLRRLDVGRGWLTTVAVGASGDAAAPEEIRTACGPESLRKLLDWARKGRVIAGAPRIDPVLRLVAPADLDGDVIAGPLASEDGPAGVVVVGFARGAVIDDDAIAVVQRLLEPFSVALENDRRFHEVARLREAAEAENRALRSRLDRQEISDAIVGAEAGLRTVMARVEQVAPTDATVLILGETGSGKEVVARAIHARSRRADGPIVRVNCGAIPPELIDSELFGHERGSFTGASATRKGWFERADGGTLFLDEVGELPLAAQVRLLRVLQDGSLWRVGGARPLSVDVRLVTATHRNLENHVAEGRFREDLWYRINVFPIRLPSLRERTEDIPALAAHFAHRAGLRLGGVPLVPTREDVALLVGYRWPGNVRELASVIERAAILGDGKRLELGAALGGIVPVAASVPPPSPIPAPAPRASVRSLDEAMRTHIEQALTAAAGRIEGPHGAARVLGINPHTLRARMRKLGIDWDRFRPRAP